MSLVGCERRDEIELEDDATEEEIEEAARDWMFEQIEWGYDMPDTTPQEGGE